MVVQTTRFFETVLAKYFGAAEKGLGGQLYELADRGCLDRSAPEHREPYGGQISQGTQILLAAVIKRARIPLAYEVEPPKRTAAGWADWGIEEITDQECFLRACWLAWTQLKEDLRCQGVEVDDGEMAAIGKRVGARIL